MDKELADVQMNDEPVFTEDELEPQDDMEAFNLASALRQGVEMCYDMIQYFDGLYQAFQAGSIDQSYFSLIDGMKKDENSHIGQLQIMLDKIQPTSETRVQGEEIAQNELSGVDDEEFSRVPLEIRQTIELDPLDKEIEDEFLQKYSDEEVF